MAQPSSSSAASEQRLDFLYRLNRGLTAFSDLEGLVRFATQRTRELFRADGCALILLDRARNELYFPVVSDADPRAEATLGELRFPADQGIAGWVLQRDEAAVVTDTANDPRFYSGIDKKTELSTKSLLCAPLRSTHGNIGVIELINPAAELARESDLHFLETIAGDVAIALERTHLVEKLRDEVLTLRQALRVVGIALTASGVLLMASATAIQLARALPLSELWTRPTTLTGLALTIGGAALLNFARLRTSPPHR